MSVIASLVTDRSKGDVDRWAALNAKGWLGMTGQERQEWMAGMKGAYNTADLNRVSEAMRYLAGRFNVYGYAVTVTSRTNWTAGDVPTVSEMNTYLRDLKALRDTYAVLEGTPKAPPDLEGLTFQEANEIEQILVNINIVIERLLKSFKRSGAFTFWSGHQPLPSAESDLGRTIDELDQLGVTVDDLDAHGTNFYVLSYGVLK